MSTQDVINCWENGIEPYTLAKKPIKRAQTPIKGLAENMATLTGKTLKNTVAGFTESTVRRLIELSIPKARERL